jgi:serine/threonine protein kinase
MLNCPHCFAENLDSRKTCQSCGGLIGSSLTTQQLSIGSRLQNGEYEILEVLGEGGFGITYHARKNSLGIEYAIKELMPLACTRHNGMIVPPRSQSVSDWQQAIQRFTREAQMLKQFRDAARYPGIVSVEDIFQEHNTTYMVMEFLSGDTLRSRLQRLGKFSSGDVSLIARKICSSLHEIHAAGLLHRDIKPDNIMLERGGRVVLIDFGSARDFSDGQTVNHTQMLTPGFAPLEQYSSAARFAPYTDLYSVGATLYALLSGIDPPDALARVTGTQLNLNLIPGEWRELINVAMAMSITERPQSAIEFVALLPTSPTLPHVSQPGTNLQNVPTVKLGPRPPLTANTKKAGLPRRKQQPWILVVAFSIIAVIGFTVNSVIVSRSSESPGQVQTVMVDRVDPSPLPDIALARKIFQEITLKKPAFVTVLMLGQMQLIVGCSTGKSPTGDSVGCVNLYHIGNQWSQQNNNDVDFAPRFTSLYSKNDFVLIKIGSESFIFFSVKSNPMGTAVAGFASVNFVLFDIKANKLISLEYSGEEKNNGSQVIGKFENVDEIRSINQDYYIFLEQQAAISPWIYRLKPIDLDFEAPQNYRKRWKIDNPIDLYQKIYGQKILAKEYEFDINQYMSNQISVIENSKFKVVTYREGDVIGYNKRTSKFFPIIVEVCNTACGFYAKFITEYEIQLTEGLPDYPSVKKLIYDLSTSTISSQP